MSKMGQYVLETQERDDQLCTSVERELIEAGFKNIYVSNTRKIAVDVKQQLVEMGYDDWEVLDELPF